jgi:hypothetical protein
VTAECGRALAAVVGVHAEVLEAPVVEDRYTILLSLDSRLPTSISQSCPSKRQLNLKIRRDRAGQPVASSERSRSSL